MKSCFPLLRSIVRCCSFIVFRLHWTSLSSSVVEPSLADVSLVVSGLPVPPLGPASLFDCATSVAVSSSLPVTVLRATRTSLACGDAAAPSSTTVSTAHSQYCLSWAHTRSYVFPRCRPKSRTACHSGSRSACTCFSCPDSGMLSALHTSLSSVLCF